MEGILASAAHGEEWWGPRQLQPHDVPGKSRLPVYCGLIPKDGSGGWFCPSTRRLQRPLCCCYTTPESAFAPPELRRYAPLSRGKIEPAHLAVAFAMRKRRRAGRCCFLSLAGQRAAAVVGACDEHETGNRKPRDHEGNNDHGVAPFCLQGLAPKRFGRSTRTPLERNAREIGSRAGIAPGPRRSSGVRAICYATRESGSPGRLRPCNIRVNSAAFYWLNYRGTKMVEVEGLAPPEWLDVSQLPWLLGDTSKLARPTGAAPAISCSTGRRLC